MPSCKDCLGFEFCSDRLCTTKYYDNVIAADNVEKLCHKFKDRTRFVELPCRVGDTVYSIKNYHINKCGVAWIRNDTRKSITIRLMTKDYTFYDVSRKDFGKTVFLTREEAEKALNSSEKSDS